MDFRVGIVRRSVWDVWGSNLNKMEDYVIQFFCLLSFLDFLDFLRDGFRLDVFRDSLREALRGIYT